MKVRKGRSDKVRELRVLNINSYARAEESRRAKKITATVLIMVTADILALIN